MEPNLDLVAQNQIIDANLERKMDQERYERWKSGNTGWPFLDACMRQLSSSGWINSIFITLFVDIIFSK